MSRLEFVEFFSPFSLSNDLFEREVKKETIELRNQVFLFHYVVAHFFIWIFHGHWDSTKGCTCCFTELFCWGEEVYLEIQKLPSDAKAVKCDGVYLVGGINAEWFSLLFLSSKVMKKLSLEPADRLASLQTLWENNKPADPGPCGRRPCTAASLCFNCVACCWLSLKRLCCCVFPLCSGGFSQMYRCVCDWLGLPYKEEVQWVGVCFSFFYVFLRTACFL